MTEATRLIVEAIRSIPTGRVSSYGRIAKLAGFPNGARQVVRILHSLWEKESLPWHRLLRVDGSIAVTGEGFELQAALLKAEGVVVGEGRVDMGKYGYP